MMVTNKIDEFRPIVLVPRTKREIELRIRELTGRLHLTIFDLAKLARLRDLLRSTGGRDD
jgi:hypothetical protein